MHDVSHETTLKVLQCLRSCVGHDNHPFPYGAVYQIVKEGISEYVARYEHLQDRLHPGASRSPHDATKPKEATTDVCHESDRS